MSVEIEIVSKNNDVKGGVIAASFKALKSSVNGTYKAYGDCTFVVKHDSKSFVPIQEVTDSLVVTWIEKSLGETRLKAIEKILSTRIKSEVKPTAKSESKK